MANLRTYPKHVKITDITLREGLMKEEKFIPTETKLFIAERLLEAGFTSLDVGTFGPAETFLQLRDTQDVLKMLPRRPNLSYGCNFYGQMKDAVVKAKLEGYGPDIVNVQLPTTEELTRHNLGYGVAERWKFIEDVVKLFHDSNIKVQISILNPWYDPILGDMQIDVALEATDRLFKIGCDLVRPCDPYGMATPPQVYEYFCRLFDAYPDPQLHAYHQHDCRGFGLANFVAAMEGGCNQFDTAVGGIGGVNAQIVGGTVAKVGEFAGLFMGIDQYRPQRGRTGLVSTEDFVVLCDAMGIETGVDVKKVLVLGAWMERILERKLWSQCLEPGRVTKGKGFIAKDKAGAKK